VAARHGLCMFDMKHVRACVRLQVVEEMVGREVKFERLGPLSTLIGAFEI
jgi:hypothetical protein